MALHQKTAGLCQCNVEIALLYRDLSMLSAWNQLHTNARIKGKSFAICLVEGIVSKPSQGAFLTIANDIFALSSTRARPRSTEKQTRIAPKRCGQTVLANPSNSFMFIFVHKAAHVEKRTVLTFLLAYQIYDKNRQ